jgi:Flp pilus assembly protein CpaB
VNLATSKLLKIGRIGLGYPAAFWCSAVQEADMVALLDMTVLAVATVGALALASAAQWAMLRLAMRSMRPATAARQGVVRTQLAHGTGQLARAFAGHR